jgi:hypothetical protein
MCNSLENRLIIYCFRIQWVIPLKVIYVFFVKRVGLDGIVMANIECYSFMYDVDYMEGKEQ